MNNLTLYLREVEKQEQKNPNLAEKRNYEDQKRNNSYLRANVSYIRMLLVIFLVEHDSTGGA